MPENLTKEARELRQDVQDFVEAVQAILGDPELSGSEKTSRISESSRSIGLYQLTQPQDVGGRNATNLEQTVVHDELGAHNLCHIGGIFGPSPGILAGVTEPLRSSHLIPMLKGEKRMAFGFTEPRDVEQPTKGSIEGETLTIRGQKSYVTGGASADFINTLVTIDGQGPMMVVVDRESTGVEIKETFGSIDGSHHAYMEFKDVKVPTTNIVGKQGKGMTTALGQISSTRLVLAAQSVGICRWVIDFTKENLAKPSRDGEPLGNKEGVRLRYADMRIKSYAARSMVYRTARLADAGENVVNELIASKVFATETVGDVVDTAIQLAGGRALQSDHPLGTLYRQVRAWRLAEGASDVLRLNLARGSLDLEKGKI